MAIIALIAAMLFPIMGRARELARRAQCANNLRQIGIAMFIYCEDHNDLFPREGGPGWYNELAPYLDITDDPFYADIYSCPTPSSYWQISSIDIIDTCFAAEALSRHGVTGLAYNINFLLNSTVRLPSVKNPSQTICIFDCKDECVGMWDDWGGVYTPADGDFYVANRHSGGANILWVDGHVSWLLKDVIINTEEWWKP